MSFFKKLFSLPVCLSACMSMSLFASNNIIDFNDLANKHPIHFNGFDKIDFSSIKRSTLEEHLLGLGNLDEGNLNKLQLLQKQLIKTNMPDAKCVESVLKNIQNSINAEKGMGYLSHVIEAAISVSQTDEDEERFFIVVGFSDPYKMIHHKNEVNLVKIFRAWSIENYDNGIFNQFVPNYNKEFVDQSREFSKTFAASIFRPTVYPMLCTKPGEDILGLFFLAYTYARGIHPIPVSLFSDRSKLHGIKMSP